ncbi:MAG: ABC transporter substrate-binding protein [Rhodospirillales bacterium]|nr:ABC transporter substrate-binding protein [Rhodospirillales bacterium]
MILRVSLVCAAAILAAGAAHAQTKITYLLTSPVPTVAEAPHASVPAVMGYWKEGGLDVTVSPSPGSTQATQLVVAGTAHFTMATVEPLIIARQKGGKVVAVYNHVREPIYTIAVPKESAITDMKQLKGKAIGVTSLASGAVPFSKAMLKSIGVDPEKDVRWVAIGLGPQASHALKENRVDALGYWDWGYAILENLGHQFRHYTTEATKNVLSLALVANEDFVASNPDAVTAMARGIAKAALFTITNPEAAVKIHWQQYPASKPTGIPEDQALKDAVHVLKARLVKYRVEGRSPPTWGAFTKAEWEATQNFLADSGLIQQKVDVAQYYNDRLLAKVNDFDANKVIAQAKGYK